MGGPWYAPQRKLLCMGGPLSALVEKFILRMKDDVTPEQKT